MTEAFFAALLGMHTISLFVGLVLTGVLFLLSGPWNGLPKGRVDVPELAQLLVIVALVWNVAMGVLLVAATAIVSHTGWAHAILVLSIAPALVTVALATDSLRPFMTVCAVSSLLILTFSFLSGFSIGAIYPLSGIAVAAAGVLAYGVARSRLKQLA